MLFELLTLQDPFVDPDDTPSPHAVLHGNPRRLTDLRPEAGSLEPLVDRALSKDPEERYHDAHALVRDLDETMLELGSFTHKRQLEAWMREVFALDFHQERRMLAELGGSDV